MKSSIAMLTGLFMLGNTLLMGGCAKDSSSIASSYVSPLEYQNYDCSQLRQELTRVGRRMSEVSGIQDDEASSDTALMAIGLVLFWPSLFFLEGDTGREAELARLKGEVDALEQAAIEKDCRTVTETIDKAREGAKKEKEGMCDEGVCDEDGIDSN